MVLVSFTASIFEISCFNLSSEAQAKVPVVVLKVQVFPPVVEMATTAASPVAPTTFNFCDGETVPTPTFPFPSTENLVPPTREYATPELAKVIAAVVILVSEAIAEMATVCPVVAGMVIVSPTLKVLVNCVPTPVTVVPPAKFETVPGPVVL